MSFSDTCHCFGLNLPLAQGMKNFDAISGTSGQWRSVWGRAGDPWHRSGRQPASSPGSLHLRALGPYTWALAELSTQPPHCQPRGPRVFLWQEIICPPWHVLLFENAHLCFSCVFCAAPPDIFGEVPFSCPLVKKRQRSLDQQFSNFLASGSLYTLKKY